MKILISGFFVWLLASSFVHAQRDNTLVIPDPKGEYESFFYLSDSVIASELASFNVAGSIYGRKPSDPLEVFTLETMEDEALGFRMQDNLVIIETEPFLAEMHRLDYFQRSGYLYRIDGSYFWGIDGKVPKRRLVNLHVEIQGQKVAVPKVAFWDIYEPNLCSRRFLVGRIKCGAAVYASPNGERIYIYMLNGRIPSLYEITWIFRNGSYIGRVVDYAF